MSLRNIGNTYAETPTQKDNLYAKYFEPKLASHHSHARGRRRASKKKKRVANP